MLRKAIFLAFLLGFATASNADRAVVIVLDQANTLNDMSPDGRYTVGRSEMGLPYIQDHVLGTFTEIDDGPRDVAAVSDDGTTLLGTDMPNPDGINGTVAAIWSSTNPTWTSIGYNSTALNCPSKSDGYDLSADGSVAVGLTWDGCSGRAFRWTEGTGMVVMEPMANGGNRASAVSADGNLIGGFAQGSFSRTPAFWDGTTGEGFLIDPPDGDALGEIYAINDEGSAMLGAVGGDATRWTNTNGNWSSELIGNGSFRPSWSGIPTDVDGDGDTIVGFDLLGGSGIRRGWITDANGDMVELHTFVQNNGGEVPIVNDIPLVFEVPRNVSTNGRVIVGHGSVFTPPWRIEVYADCDFDSDLDCDLDDVDSLVSAISSGTMDDLMDLNGDGQLDNSDLNEWLSLAGAENLDSGGAYLLGDANLDGSVDVSDFNTWNANKFVSTAAWSKGDFNADGVTDASDFNVWNANKFLNSDSPAAVPEPGSFVIALFNFVLVAGRQRIRGIK